MTQAFVLSAVRTPIGKFLGGLSELPAPDLGAVAIRWCAAFPRVRGIINAILDLIDGSGGERGFDLADVMAQAQPVGHCSPAWPVSDEGLLNFPILTRGDLQQPDIAQTQRYLLRVFFANGCSEPIGDFPNHGKRPRSNPVYVLRVRPGKTVRHRRCSRADRVEISVFIDVVERTEREFVTRWV